MPAAERYEIIKHAGYCYNCLACNHVVAECWTKTQCRVQGCQQRHSRWLHPVSNDYIRIGRQVTLARNRISAPSSSERRRERKPPRGVATDEVTCRRATTRQLVESLQLVENLKTSSPSKGEGQEEDLLSSISQIRRGEGASVV